VKKEPTSILGKKRTPLYERIRQILESARINVARTVNTTQVVANWMIGREIVEEEQQGKAKAAYGEHLLMDLSVRLKKEFGTGYSVDNLEMFRRFYYEYPSLISEAMSRKSNASAISDAPRRKLPSPKALPGKLNGYAMRSESWQAGQLHPNLSWTHYRTFLRVDKVEARAFYEIEAIHNNWSARELERQINCLLYERLALSKDKKGLMRLAKKGQEIQRPVDVFKDPVVMEFLGLPASPKIVETDLEQALIKQPSVVFAGTGQRVRLRLPSGADYP
jgi:predicted nuclease of restriction endonuclease-like (RecB) superfamily